MRHILVVANQTAADDALIEAVRQRSLEGGCEVTVVTPATPLSEQERAMTHSEIATRYFGESGAVALAKMRLGQALRRLAQAGIKARGEVGYADPVKAVEVMLQHGGFDEIVVSTLPRGRSRWLARDLPGRLRRKFGLPVTHVVAAPSRSGHGRRRGRTSRVNSTL